MPCRASCINREFAAARRCAVQITTVSGSPGRCWGEVGSRPAARAAVADVVSSLDGLEEDPRYVERAIRNDVLGYVEARAFAGKRVLDFGCGAGASTLVMSRMLPP